MQHKGKTTKYSQTSKFQASHFCKNKCMHFKMKWYVLDFKKISLTSLYLPDHAGYSRCTWIEHLLMKWSVQEWQKWKCLFFLVYWTSVLQVQSTFQSRSIFFSPCVSSTSNMLWNLTDWWAAALHSNVVNHSSTVASLLFIWSLVRLLRADLGNKAALCKLHLFFLFTGDDDKYVQVWREKSDFMLLFQGSKYKYSTNCLGSA